MTFTRKTPTHAHVYVTSNENTMIRQYEHNEQEFNSFARNSFSINMNYHAPKIVAREREEKK